MRRPRDGRSPDGRGRTRRTSRRLDGLRDGSFLESIGARETDATLFDRAHPDAGVLGDVRPIDPPFLHDEGSGEFPVVAQLHELAAVACEHVLEQISGIG